MCGICGYASPAAGTERDTPDTLSLMLDTLYWRGPDDEGRFQTPGIVMGMRRLAVIDPNGGKQPWQDTDSGVTLVYNGELYNHLSLRKTLEQSGHVFSSQSDTEVVARAYLEYGAKFVNHLNGMFGLAIWDPRNQSLLLARDHLGQKPLYYHQNNNTLVFASDLRAVLAHPDVPSQIDMHSLSDYLRYRHVPGPHTIIAGIRQLPPGHLLIYQGDGVCRETPYWVPSFTPDKRMDLHGAVEEFNKIWPGIVQRHMLSDVPLGAFLSGGIDSSLVVAEAVAANANFKTFSIAFGEKDFDETPYAVNVAQLLGSEHQVIEFTGSLATLLEEWARAYDQPFADPACFPLLILARESRRHITVALTGDGGDELFAGYQRYRSTLLGRRIAHIPKPLRQLAASTLASIALSLPAGAPSRRWLDAAARRIGLIKDDIATEYQQQFWTFNDQQLSSILNESHPTRVSSIALIENRQLLEEMLHYDMTHWLPDQMLVKMDRASMAYSLEARLPFLDREMVDFSLRIPAATHISGRTLKCVLRNAAAQRLPHALANRPKHGFAVPVDRWLRAESNLIDAIFENGLKQNPDLLNHSAVQRLWSEHKTGKFNHGERLLTLVILLVWIEAVLNASQHK